MRKILILLLALIIVLVIVNPVSSVPEPLTNGVEPSFSHYDGKIVYSKIEKGRRDIYIIDEKKDRIRLLDDIFWDGQPSFSRDDNVVFVSDRNGNRQLWQIGLNGEGLKQLTNSPGWKSSPSSNLMGDIAFTSGRFPKLDIFILENGMEKRITYYEDEIYSPVWSPDGDKLAFVIGDDLMIMNRDGSTQLNVASGVYSRGISWSNDGHILFLKRDKGYDLFSLDLEDREAELVFKGVTDSWEINPTINHKGDIAFSTDKDGYYHIYILDLEISTPNPKLEAVSSPILAPLTAPNPAVQEIPVSEPLYQSYENPAEKTSDNPKENPGKDEINLPLGNTLPNKEMDLPDPTPTRNREMSQPEIPLPIDQNPYEKTNHAKENLLNLIILAMACIMAIFIEKEKNKRPKIQPG